MNCIAYAHSSQRGFIAKRQLVANVKDLDTYGRIFGMIDPDSCQAFLDYLAAFPSVSHEWLFAALGLRNLIGAHYCFVMAYTEIDGVMHFLYMIFSGVLQGCPWSGSLFALAIDPMLCRFEEELTSNKDVVVRACADDIGMALQNFTISRGSNLFMMTWKRFLVSGSRWSSAIWSRLESLARKRWCGRFVGTSKNPFRSGPAPRCCLLPSTLAL